MPKNFPFYRPDSHQHIIRLLDTKRPSAIITAAPRDGVVVGATYPWPMIADGDIDIPSVYVSDEESRRLAEMAGRPASLTSSCTRIPSIGRNVIARRGPDAGKQVVLVAHIDTKMGTPGAVDNASGVVTLLLLAERLADYAGNIRIELVAMNGEEHYASPGEQQYLTEKRCDLTEIALAVNLDGLGYRDGNTAYSMYGCPPDVVSVVRDTFGSYLGLMEGEPWYQGDHTMFLQNQRPALAITSEQAMQLLAQVIHSPKDCPEIVDVSRLVEMANALRDLVQALDQHLEENPA